MVASGFRATETAQQDRQCREPEAVVTTALRALERSGPAIIDGMVNIVSSHVVDWDDNSERSGIMLCRHSGRCQAVSPAPHRVAPP
ncbi:hypothetical protein FB471_1011 [Amycolatopsis cihanbeyliensis]|uniref:Uncharacterized protein n=1 Tax=Amycolatopsis cihanbeyliensis TaxID=1128664 RepID=A0A542DE33_AMYCI|nr:hypothetical protein FB471_1011 [Amycolatopsis cihanbeyliensis]